MKEKMKKYQLPIIIVTIVVLVSALAVAAWFILVNFEKNKDNNKKPDTEISEDVDKDKTETDDSAKDEDKVYITDCDNTDGFDDMMNITVIRDKGLYTQGKGAFINSSTLTVFAAAKMKERVDVSEYKGGAIHLSFYIGSKENFKENICFEISSAGTYDQDELQWSIPLYSVAEGWNEKWLPISDAAQTGNIDLSMVNYFRFYSPDLDTSKSVDVILDDVYATKTIGENSSGGDSVTADGTITEDDFEETGTDKGTRILSCNTMNVLSSVKNLQVTTKRGEFVEGSGAMKLVGADYLECHFKNPIDLSDYQKDNSVMHVSFYINDASLLNGLVYFYLSSAGNIDDEVIYWYLQPYEFQSGWNELEVPFYTSALKRNPDFSAINYLKMHCMGMKEGAVVIIDDIYATNK